MLGKYGESSSGSMKNLENGLRDRVLYHQNMLSMNLTTDFYHNPFLANPAGNGNSNVGLAQPQKIHNTLPSTGGTNHPQQQPQHGSNGSTTAAGVIPPSPTGTNSAATQQALAQFQCQLCPKIFNSSAVLAQHMKTHDSMTPGGRSYVQQQPATSSPSMASNSKTSPPLLTQQIIKSEYAVGSGQTGQTTNQFPTSYGFVKQFECQICHKSFMTMVNLNLHMKIHETQMKSALMYSQTVGASGPSGGNMLTGSTGPASYHNSHHNHHSQQQQQQQPQQHHSMHSTGGTTDGQCQICHKTFSTADQFATHMKIHENEFKNRALYHSNGIDGATVPASNGVDHFYPGSSQPTQVMTHAAPHLDASKGHRCPICHKMSNNIIEHIKQHEGQLTMGGSSGGATPEVGSAHQPVAAGFQNANDDSLSSLEDESDGGADGRKHECLICHKKFSSSGNLAIHIRVHSGEKPFKCSVCGKGFIQSNNLATHMKTHTGEKPYACTICGKNFSQSNNLKTHIRTHTGEKPYACTICGKRFNQKNNLTTHMRTHQLVCMVCGLQFMHPSDLANHMKFHNDEKPFICSVCNKVYLNLDELTEHMKKTHNQVKPYRCHICDKTFTQSNNLKTHIKTHIFQDPYKCQMCSRSFQKEDDYSQHMLVHTADKPYECTYCGKRFIQSNNLKTHVRTHTGEKPYRCTICAKHFNQKNNLNTHMRIHTGEKPFECTICDKRFNQSNNLNKHIKTHGQEKDQQHAS